MVEHEPGVARSLADSAVGDDVVVGREAGLVSIDGFESAAALEGPVVLGGSLPRDVRSARDVAASQGAFVGVVRHVHPLARVFLRRADIDERKRCFAVGHRVGEERSQGSVVALRRGIFSNLPIGDVRGHRLSFVDPLLAAAIEQAEVLMPEQGEHPQGICGPPVEVVAVEDHR